MLNFVTDLIAISVFGCVSCWGLVQLTKKIIGYATPNLPKDLSISNIVTVGVRTHTLVDRPQGLRSRTSVDDEDDEANLKVNADLGATTPVSHERHLRILAHVR
jgi:hypothetical protein